MNVFLMVSIVILGLLEFLHLIFFFIWLSGHLTLKNFFQTRKGAFIFLIPIVGFFGLLFGAVRARIDEDF